MGVRAKDWWKDGGAWFIKATSGLLSGLILTLIVALTSPDGLFSPESLLFLIPLALFFLFVWATYADWHTRQEISDLREKHERTIREKDHRHDQQVTELADRASALQVDVEEREKGIAELLDVFLRLLMLELDPAKERNSTDRISLYSFDDQNEEFTIAKRHSNNEELRQRHRVALPKQEGCIGKAWRSGQGYAYKLMPDPQVEPEEYITECLRQNIPRDTARSLTMKPRSLFAWRVRSLGGGEPVAVIVAESKEYERWADDNILVFFKRRSDEIRNIVDLVQTYLPEPALAETKGL